MNVDKLIGAWTLISSVQSRNGVISKTFGDPPAGQLQYTRDGRMAAFLMDPEWARDGKISADEADRFFAYAGSWQLLENEVRHSIEFCSAPSKIGTVFVRFVKFVNDNEMELVTAPETTRSGNTYETKLVWRRFAQAAS